jgi:UTP--glucose-1-phosphate uridylyltransferase
MIIATEQTVGDISKECLARYPAHFRPFAERMCAEGLPAIFIDNFAWYYDKLAHGDDGLIPEAAVKPVTDLPDAEKFGLALAEVGQEALARTTLIKLNGGLGTGMGLRAAKSLLPVRDGLTFLDIIARQAMRAGVPLLLMNSYVTEADSLEALARYPELERGLPLSFVQHKEPKIVCADLQPADWPVDPALEWCPPGHGDLYVALITSGMLEALLAAGYEYAFVSNADNLGAVLDLPILGYFATNELPFMMEVADRSESDRKGGHLARLPDGRLLLRELAQCPSQDVEAFQDIARHRFFNTNNLWLHLPTLARVMIERDYRLGLPMIRNRKPIDPRRPESTPVYQLETAMGTAISVFEGAQAVRVPRSRFAPVKKTDDLLAVRSDAYLLTEDDRVVLHPARREIPPVIELEPQYYQFIHLLDERFPAGPPSLLDCDKMRVSGDVRFGRGVIVRGNVHVLNETGDQVCVPEATVLDNERWSA